MLRHNSVNDYVQGVKELKNEFKKDLSQTAKIYYNWALLEPNTKRLINRIVLLGCLLMLISIIFSVYSSSRVFQNTTYDSEAQPTYTGQASTGVTQNQKDTTIQILDGYKIAIEFFSPIFDSFIGETPDPTGKVESAGDSYRYNPLGSYPLQFRSGDKLITVGFNAFELSNSLLGAAIVVLTLLIVVRSINNITDEDGDQGKLKPFLYRTGYTVIMLLLTPHILGLSIYLNNVLVRSFTNDSSLTGFLSTYLTDLKNQIIDAPTKGGWWDFSNILSPGANLVEGIISTLPLNLALLLIILLFLYISFQFVIRFINLFFLSVIYPLVSIFYISEKTSNIPANYWKIWIGFLIHQPSFILGFIIVQRILSDALITTGPEPQLLIFFLGMLLFLATINIVVSRIWAESFSAISTNIQAGIGTRLAVGAAKWSAGRAGSTIAGLKTSSARASNQKGIATNQLGKNIRTNAENSKNSNLKVKHNKLYNPTKSGIGQKYQNQGFKVSSVDADKGVLGISGNFYTYEDPNTNSTVYYSSLKDAQQDGLQESQLKRETATVQVLDTSNRQARQAYNMDLSREAAKNNIPQKDVRITQSPSEDRIKKNLEVMKNRNQKAGIEGVAVTRYPKNAKQGDGSQQIYKIYKHK